MTGTLHSHAAPEAALRPPGQVMRLDRMGAGFPHRLSFLRTVLRRLRAEGARVQRPVWDLDEKGYGRAVYTVELGGHSYALAAFSQALPDAARTDRVIAERWDATFALCDGVPDTTELDRLERNVPLQEAGRLGPGELVLSRANKSVRVFEHVVDALAAGQQPDRALLDEIGYLMRTTAVYGNGKFGIADRAQIADRPGLSGPFQAEMLAVWLIRAFTHDLVDHVARARAPDRAVPLAPEVKRHLGIGNATGLGMAPFLVNHPELLHAWIATREQALARVRALPRAGGRQAAVFRGTLGRARAHAQAWAVPEPRQMARIVQLRDDLAAIGRWVADGALDGPQPWGRLIRRSADLGIEAQECLVALVLEPHGALIDDLAEEMSVPVLPRLDGAMRLSALSGLLHQAYDWALAVDFDAPAETALFWYVSEDKMEPRLGHRREEPGADLELPLDIARQVQALAGELGRADPGQSVAEFLLPRPHLRHILRRVQVMARRPYGEIRDNLIAETCLPIDLLRCKLAFFGATRFDPKSDRWTRITLFQGAPLHTEIAEADPDGWCFPDLSGTGPA